MQPVSRFAPSFPSTAWTKEHNSYTAISCNPRSKLTVGIRSAVAGMQGWGDAGVTECRKTAQQRYEQTECRAVSLLCSQDHCGGCTPRTPR